MAELIPLTDPEDDRLADYVRLRDASLRRHLEAEQGLFIAEGAKVIRRALAAGYRPRSFLLAERWLPGLADVLEQHPSTPVYLVQEELTERLTGFHVHRGALASMHREVRHGVEELLTARRLVVCEDVVDHTNVGAVLRSAAGLGFDGCLLAPRAADPLYRRSVKVSMGAVFSLPWARLPDWDDAVPMLRRAGLTTVALALAEDAVDLADLAADVAARTAAGSAPRLALLLGTEGPGLSERWRGQADVVVRIPMHAGIDSLNVAAAAAVACWALRP